MDLLGSLLSSMTSQSSLSSLSEKSEASPDQISSLLSSALPKLMGQVSSNASTKEGADSLMHALSQHTSTASVEDQIKDADLDDGGKIIGHIFGSDLDSVLSELSGKSDLSVPQVSSILDSVAPAMMSGISGSLSGAAGKNGAKIDLSDGIDMKDVAGLLSMVLGGSDDNGKSEEGLGGGLGGIIGAIGSIFNK